MGFSRPVAGGIVSVIRLRDVEWRVRNLRADRGGWLLVSNEEGRCEDGEVTRERQNYEAEDSLSLLIPKG